ncbi:hypothetical protein JIN84_00775 [Luteolibacter yonseiensis]|uniref:Uncharacterized protein n=1 Tax=Luteolibacter yonseiensis TaxID=1144680 RepID=A0A934R0L6_9BACT|nr:hypothetical protein [Luteolibacter yonseiensis]MBK1814141.1 hypothetical protein [Luteolibacter yonseiensis]
MIRLLAISWMTGLLVLHAAEPHDLLRFGNGDQLHGKFMGIKEGPQVVWQRGDVTAPVEFKTDQLRHIVLNGGRPKRGLAALSHVALVNGDRIPGTVASMDEKGITLETTYAGSLRIPREQVAMLAPAPLGGRLHYHGPFIEDEWKMADASSPEGIPASRDEKDQGGENSGRWQFSGSAWYWPGKLSGTALLKENTMPDRAILRFDVAWRNRLSLAIGFHADFKKPEKKPADGNEPEAQPRRQNGFSPGDSSVFPTLFGNAYVLQIFSTHMMLFRVSADGTARVPVERIPNNGASIRLGESGTATVEIRCSRISGEIAVFINGDSAARWSEQDGTPPDAARYSGKGNGFGFVVQTEESPVRISDIMTAEWNGMPDAARSMQTDEQDIVLLANGTDRFSGKVGGFSDGRILMENKYGRFQFELDDIAEIRFARNKLATESEPAAGSVMVRMGPLGRISGKPVSGNADGIRLLNPICGEMNFNLESAVMLDFQNTNNIIDDWDAEF